MRNFSETLSNIIASSGLNLNQTSKMSGTSNACLTTLIKGHINKPGKDQIASSLLALGHPLNNIDAILTQCDDMPLNRYGVPESLYNSRRRKFEGRILSQLDNILNFYIFPGTKSDAIYLMR